MKIKTFFVALTVLGLLTGCTQTNHQPIAKMTSDHDTSGHFENIAKEMQAKKAEQEKLLEQYETKSYLYGRQAEDLKSHTQALIRNYQQAIEEANTKLANGSISKSLSARINTITESESSK